MSVKKLLESINTTNLRALADWLDMKYKDDSTPEVQADLRKWADNIDQALALLAKPEPCKTCRGSKEVWDTQEFAGRETGDKVPCPRCKGTGIEPDCPKPEPTKDAGFWGRSCARLCKKNKALHSIIDSQQAENEQLKNRVKTQGKECEERHNFMCGIKEIVDEYFESE